jgi:hypothetical protein
MPLYLKVIVAVWVLSCSVAIFTHLWLVRIGLDRLGALSRQGINGDRRTRAMAFIYANALRTTAKMLMMLAGLSPVFRVFWGPEASRIALYVGLFGPLFVLLGQSFLDLRTQEAIGQAIERQHVRHGVREEERRRKRAELDSVQAIPRHDGDDAKGID